jgi:anti-sigma factor RsiW
MPCPEFEDLILDYCEGAASPADSALLESHVAACAGCRQYLATQQELDLRLTNLRPSPALSPEFAAHLAARIAVEGQPRQLRWLPRMLDGVGYISMAAAAVYLMQQVPHAASWLGLTALAGSAAFTVWQTGKALRSTYGHRSF